MLAVKEIAQQPLAVSIENSSESVWKKAKFHRLMWNKLDKLIKSSAYQRRRRNETKKTKTRAGKIAAMTTMTISVYVNDGYFSQTDDVKLEVIEKW